MDDDKESKEEKGSGFVPEKGFVGKQPHYNDVQNTVQNEKGGYMPMKNALRMENI